MTKAKISALVRRRDDLVARIAIERAVIARDGAALQRLSRIVDKVRDGLRYLKRHPEALLLPAVIAVVARPWRLLTWAISGVGLWRMAWVWRRRVLHMNDGIKASKQF
jgi:hypothetical protein